MGWRLRFRWDQSPKEERGLEQVHCLLYTSRVLWLKVTLAGSPELKALLSTEPPFVQDWAEG